MSISNTAAHEKLRAIRENYTNGLPQKIHEIEDVWAELVGHEWDQENLVTLHHHTHSLAGSGSTFGYEDISNTAHILDTEIKALMDVIEIPDASILKAIKTKLDGLKQVCDDAVSALKQEPDNNIVSIFSLPEQRSINKTKHILFLQQHEDSCNQLASQIQQYGYSVSNIVVDENVSIKDIEEIINRQIPDGLVFSFNDYAGKLNDVISELNFVIGADTPTIFINSNGDMNQRLGAVRCGSDAYFVAPVDIPAFIDKLDFFYNTDVSEPYRVLIVDDSQSLANAYSMFLQQAGIETLVVTEPLKAFESLYELKPDLVLLDMYMPKCSGPELASVIRQQESYTGIPIVFLSGEVDVDKQLYAMSLGGDDFLTKPIKPDHLISSVKTRAERYRKLRNQMVRDSLTGLYNHSKTEEQLHIELSRAERNQHELAYVMVDLDHFKSINDQYGHAAGDMVLKSIARLLQKTLRKTDIIGRYGGEEFAVILYGTNTEQAFDVMENIRTDFEEIEHLYDNQVIKVTLSCGIAVYPQFKEFSELHKAADQALYAAKNERNKVVVAS